MGHGKIGIRLGRPFSNRERPQVQSIYMTTLSYLVLTVCARQGRPDPSEALLKSSKGSADVLAILRESSQMPPFPL
jgi:hypothetical protein